jgi:F0F1-type ATP synthase membrane subunit b/b'
MAAKRKDDSKREVTDAQTKLSRLLQTEDELEAMLKDARREAKELVEAAQAAADERFRRFESQLEEEDRQLQDRIAGERDRTIDSIREEARQEAERLDGLDDATITELAHYIVDLLMARPDSWGSS